MNIAIIAVVAVLIISLLGTIFVMMKEDPAYGESTKRNTVNLTLIYVITFLLVGIAVTWFLVRVV